MHPLHLDAVIEIERRAYPVSWSRRVFEDCLQVGYSSWILTDTTARIVGYALMSVAVDEAHILNICIDPDYQRRGLAGRLLDHLIHIAAHAGAVQMLLEVRVSNHAALALYSRAGFREIGLRKGYYPTADRRTEDARVLALPIGA